MGFALAGYIIVHPNFFDLNDGCGSIRAGRNIHIYDARNPDVMLGGLTLTNGVTNANLYSMIEIFLWFNQDYFLRHEGGIEVQRDEQAFRPGNYYLVTNGMFFHCIVQPVLSSKQAPSLSTRSPGWFVRFRLLVVPEL